MNCIKCDNCGKEDKEKFRPIVVSCGYGSKHDDEQFDFCSEKCLIEFFTKDEEEDDISYCNSCHCMTKKKNGYIYICGKCGKDRRKKE